MAKSSVPKGAMSKHGISTGAGHVPAAKSFKGKSSHAPRQPDKVGQRTQPSVKTHY